MKNAFYFTFHSQIFKLLYLLFGHVETWFYQRDNVNFKIYSITTFQTIAIHMLPNIARSNGNQRMKFGRIIEYNVRSIFLEKLCTECGGETIFRPFSKKSKLSVSLDQQSKVLCSLFLLNAQLRAIEILKLSCSSLAFTLGKGK